MNYLVNDIQNLIKLDEFGLLRVIRNHCSSLSVTNVRIQDFSENTWQKKFRSTFTEHEIIEIEVDITYYNFTSTHSAILSPLGNGDKSSLYQAKSSNLILVTNNPVIEKCAAHFDIEVIKFPDFITQFINDKNLLKLCKIA